MTIIGEYSATVSNAEMPNRSTRLLVALLSLWTAAPTQAQTGPRRIVSFEEAVGLALDADVVGRDLLLQDQALQSDAQVARSAGRPTLGLGVTPSQGFGLGFDQTTGAAATQSRTAVSLQATGQLQLYDGGRIRARVAEITGVRTVVALSREDARRRTVLVVAGLYTRVLIGQGLVTLAEADSAAQGEQLAQVRTFVRAGVRPPADTLAQRTSVAGTRRTLAGARQGLRIDRVALARALGMVGGQTIVAVPPPDDPSYGGVTAGPTGTAGRDGRRADVAAADARVEAARLSVAAVRRDRMPTVSIGAFGGTDFSSLQTRPDAAGDPQRVPVFGQFSSNRSASAFATISVPLFDGRVTRAREERARVAVSQAELASEAVRLDASAEAAQAAARVDGAVEELAAAAEQATLAEAYAEVQLRRYQLAAGSLFEWSDARTRYVAAAAAAEEARHLLWLARAEADLVGSVR